MMHRKTSLTLLFCCTVFLLGLFALPSLAEIPQVISYQGKVTDTGGTPVSDGSYSMRFRIYDAVTGDTLQWDSGTHFVGVSGGIFNVLLGESPQPACTLAFDQDYWMLTTFDGDDLIPRQQLGSVGYAFMASGLVPGTEVNGWVSSGFAIKGTNTSTIGTCYGVYGESNSTAGRGVRGHTTATSGANFGVYGSSSSSIGVGVYGTADKYGVKGVTAAPSGEVYGVYGEAESTGGYGVYGKNVNNEHYGYLGGNEYGVYGHNDAGPYGYIGGVTDGVYGMSNSTAGRGVYGHATATTGTTYGGRFESASALGRGVEGYVSATTGQTYGGRFESSSTDGTGVFGYATATVAYTAGVLGFSASADGSGVCGCALATTGTTYGVYGKSNSTAGHGVYGEATAISGTTYGGRFESASASGRGVEGYVSATTGQTYGGRFESSSTDGTGVFGYATATVAYTHGVLGFSASTDGSGVCGSALATTGTTYGVYGKSNSTDGYGVYYEGGLAGSGTKSCVVKTSKGPTLMYCQESPESWFEDFGEGRLENGRARINIDPLFLETVTVNTENPIKVFLTPNGPLGEWWVEKDADGFSVIAADAPDGTEFDYRVVAKRQGFEQKRLDYCKAAETDSYLYPELREKELREHEEERARMEGEHTRMEEARRREEDERAQLHRESPGNQAE